MNKGKLKTFAVEARRELLEKVELQARRLGITENNIAEATVESSDALFIDGQPLGKKERDQRNNLIQRINELSFDQVVEEVAYTWFNRFIALRFMEVNDYLPTRVRVLSSTHGGNEPDMINDALTLDLELDQNYIYELKLANKTDELFKYLVLAHCNDLSNYLPFMFGTIEHYTEILFPEGLLSTDSFVQKMIDIEEFPEDNWYEVEIIGWLYQYYISEENERLISAKKAYKVDEIPAVTQLFTPEWIVRYMVQNTLGKKWVEAHPEDRDLIDDWEYYLENTDPTDEELRGLEALINPNLKVEELTLIDPAMGSGHILVYMFDVLREIYVKQGYTEREIPRTIIENNLHGLDIDERAYQLAAFSVIMKGVEYNSRFLRDIKKNGIQLNLVAIADTDSFTEEDIQFLANQNNGKDFDKMKSFIDQFKYAKEIGSLLIIDDVDMEFFTSKLNDIKTRQLDLIEIGILDKVYDQFKDLIMQTNLLSNTYDVYVTNPPYLGRKYQTSAVKSYLERYYDDVKSDLFSSFIVSSQKMTKENGYIGFMTPYVWMFISSHEKLRNKIINNSTISSLIQLEYSGFDGATVPICTFTLKNNNSNLLGEYVRLTDFVGSKNQPIKTREAIANPNVPYRFTFKQENYKEIPGIPIAYWISKNAINTFINNYSIKDYVNSSVGIQTGNNNNFLRNWWEVEQYNIQYNAKNIDSTYQGKNWFPYNKGGKFRKWYGNDYMVINWKNDGLAIKNNSKKTGKHYQEYSDSMKFKPMVTWSRISSGNASFRYKSGGFLSDMAGFSLYSNNENLINVIAFCNSVVAKYYLDFLSPTLNFMVGNITSMPYINKNILDDKIELVTKEIISLSKWDWDSFELSWNFKNNPLIAINKYKEQYLLSKEKIEILTPPQIFTTKISEAYEEYKEFTNNHFLKMKENEEELNRIFIDIYGLQDELTPEVSDRDITITKVFDSSSDIDDGIKGNKYVLTKKDVIQQFISYAVGCMLGRYSSDKEGLIYAGGEFDTSKYEKYDLVKDNIIPFTSDVYLENDIVSRFVDFVKIVYGKETLEENLSFIADAIGQRKNETSRETLHRYFLTNFYKDHAKMYSVTGSGKRPIYWQFTSGKEKAFNALIYMHRYDKTSLSRIRTDYVHEVQQRLDIKQTDLDNIINSDASASEISKARKELKSVEKQIAELIEYDEKLQHMADQQIEIDLDDGFKVNYPKFKGLVAKV